MREEIIKALKEIAEAEADVRGLECEIKMINSEPRVTTSQNIQKAVAESAALYGLSSHSMVSRAYHDSLFVARKVPTAMIFVPSADGISHRPDEYTSPQEMANGAAVLATTLARLSH